MKYYVAVIKESIIHYHRNDPCRHHLTGIELNAQQLFEIYKSQDLILFLDPDLARIYASDQVDDRIKRVPNLNNSIWSIFSSDRKAIENVIASFEMEGPEPELLREEYVRFNTISGRVEYAKSYRAYNEGQLKLISANNGVDTYYYTDQSTNQNIRLNETSMCRIL